MEYELFEEIQRNQHKISKLETYLVFLKSICKSLTVIRKMNEDEVFNTTFKNDYTFYSMLAQINEKEKDKLIETNKMLKAGFRNVDNKRNN